MSKTNETLFRCCDCKHMLPTTEYWAAPHFARGVSYRCKQCHREYLRQYRKQDKEKERHRKEMKAYRERHPQRVKAQAEAGRNRKKLLREACESCGSTGRLHMHHPDYSKPLEVLTVCMPCHELIHHQGKTL